MYDQASVNMAPSSSRSASGASPWIWIPILILSCLHFSLYLLDRLQVQPRIISISKDFEQQSINRDSLLHISTNTTAVAATRTTLPTESDKLPSCWRRCAHRNNHIVVNFNSSAGLGDRFYIINQLANVAGYLCANLHIPAPRYFLAPKHNRGAIVAFSTQWADLQNWTWSISDIQGQPLTYDLFPLDDAESANLTKNGMLSHLYPIDGLHRTLAGNQKWYSTVQITPSPQHHIVAQRKEGASTFLRLEEVVEQQWQDFGKGILSSDVGSFLWEIPINPYEMGIFDGQTRDAILQKNQTVPPSFPEGVMRGDPDGCRYVSKDTSRNVEAVTNMVWEDVLDPTATVGLMHLRRGDAISQCNTSIARLREYFQCSFNDTEKYGKIKMLLATDETDTDYIAEVKATLENMYPHVSLVHVDSFVEKHIQNYANGESHGSDPNRFLNNFVTFQVTNELRWKRAAFSIELRRHECNECDYLSSWSKVKWAGMQ